MRESTATRELPLNRRAARKEPANDAGNVGPLIANGLLGPAQGKTQDLSKSEIPRSGFRQARIEN